jgi:hypothetical protein
LEVDTFWRHFLLNETTFFVQNDAVSCTVKKRAQNGAILNYTMHILFHLDAYRQGKKKFFSPATPLSPLAQTLT